MKNNVLWILVNIFRNALKAQMIRYTCILLPEYILTGLSRRNLHTFIVERLKNLESLYAEEQNLRLSLEQSLFDVNSMLDETQYGPVPQKIRQSIQQTLSYSEQLAARRGDRAQLPTNVTQLDSDDELSQRSTGAMVIIT